MYGDLQPRSQTILPGKTGHLFTVMRVASFHNSNRFASCSFDGTVRIWDGEKQEKVLFYFSEAIEGLQITPDDKKVIVVLGDSSRAFYHDLEKDQTDEIGENLVIRKMIGTNSNSSKVAIATYDDDVYVYNLLSKKLVGSRIFVENLSGDSMVWLDEDVICVPKRNGSVALVDSRNRTIKQEIPVHDGLITSICRDRDNIVTVSEDGTGKVLDLDFNPLFGFKIEFTPLSVDYSAQEGRIVVVGDRNMLIVNTATGDLLLLSQDLSGCNAIITQDSKIIKGSGDRDISIFSLAGEKISQIDGHSKTAEVVSFLKDNQIIIASGDKHVHHINYTTTQDQTLAAHQETVSSVLVIPSKNYVISGAYDDTISIWDLLNQSEVKRIKKVPLVTALARSPSDDIFIAACSGDNTLHVFNTEGKKVTNWEAHDDFISSVFFMNDEVIISGADDSFIKFWKRDGKLISSIETKSPIKSIGTTLEFDYNVTGHVNGDLIFWEKISNRKIASYNCSAPIQRIKVIDSSTLYFAAQNRLYRMLIDGHHITDVQEVCRHTEPIRGIQWQEKTKKIITVAHNIEIFETTFVAERELAPPLVSERIDEEVADSSTTVIFAPGVEEEQELTEVSQPVVEQVTEVPKERTVSATDIEHMTKISEYLTAITQQIKESVVPKLESFEIDVDELENALDKVQENLQEWLVDYTEKKTDVEEKIEESPPQEKKPDWTSIDWGRRKG